VPIRANIQAEASGVFHPSSSPRSRRRNGSTGPITEMKTYEVGITKRVARRRYGYCGAMCVCACSGGCGAGLAGNQRRRTIDAAETGTIPTSDHAAIPEATSGAITRSATPVADIQVTLKTAIDRRMLPPWRPLET
jgi:hypothetical protein